MRRLAGLDTSKPGEPGKTKSIADVAREGWSETSSAKGTPHKEAANGKMPSGVSKRDSASFSKSPSGMKGKVDTSGKLSGLATTAGSNNNSTERSNPVSWQAPAGKDKEKTVEKEFRSESQHTVSKEQTTAPGQNISTVGNNTMGGSTQNISNIQQNITESKNQTTMNDKKN